jgi:hypothetical protein
MPPQNQNFEDLPYDQRVRIVQAVMLFPALTLMVFIRRKVGFRLLKPTWLIVMAIILNGLSGFVASDGMAAHFYVAAFAIAMVALGLLQRRNRWRDICNGVRWHTYTSGISYLERLPLPEWLVSERKLYRTVEPLLGLIVGLTIRQHVSIVLGAWIIFASLGLFMFEQLRYEKWLDAFLDALDSLVESEIHAENVKHFDDKGEAGEEQRSLEDNAGIPTGLGADIQKQIQVRRANLNAMKDNLAPDVEETVV